MTGLSSIIKKQFCPQCGFDFIHLVAVRVQRQRDITEITAKGGHYGTIKLNFHKGQVLVSLIDKGTTEFFNLPDIWRD